MNKDERILLLVFVLSGFVGMLMLPMFGMLYLWDEIAKMPMTAWKLAVIYKSLSIVWCMATYAIQFGLCKIIYKNVICKQLI